MHQLEQVQHGFGLDFGRADLDQRADGEVREVYLVNGGEGFWVVPGQDEGGRYILAASVSNSENFRL